LALDRKDAGLLARGFTDAVGALTRVERAELEELQRDAIYNGLTFFEFEQLVELIPELKDWQSSVQKAAHPAVSPYVLIAAAMSGANL